MQHADDSGIDPATLRNIEFSRRCFWFWICFAAIVEGGSLAGFVLLADWSDPLHQLLAVMSLLIYGTLGLCMMALLFQVRYWMLRVVKAALPWLGILFILLILVTYIPWISTLLPNSLMGPELIIQ